MIFALLCSLMFATGLNAEQGKTSMKNATVVDRPSLMVIGIACRTMNSPEAAPQDIPKLWSRFYQENIMNRVPNKASNEIVCLYCDYEDNFTKPYTCLIGCPVTSLDDVPEGMAAKCIPGGSYALYRAIGEHPKTLIETWKNIWSGNVERIRTYTGDYEIYGEKFSSGSPQEIEVCVAIDLIQ